MKTRVENDVLVSILQNGGIAVLPSDTLYGVMTSALREASVERMFELRDRASEKPFIVLLAKPDDMYGLGVKPSLWAETLFERLWPGPISLVLPVTDATPAYLHRGTHTLAVRVPDDADLRALIARTGPLIAPSANLPGLPPAETAYWARQYFMDGVDYYFDGGYKGGEPSTVAAVLGERLTILREGAFGIEELKRLVGEDIIRSR